MTKEEAREMLNDYVTSIVFTGLPINDVNIFTEIKSPEPKIYKDIKDQEADERPYEFIQWTFRGLIKIAYDLDEKEN